MTAPRVGPTPHELWAYILNPHGIRVGRVRAIVLVEEREGPDGVVRRIAHGDPVYPGAYQLGPGRSWEVPYDELGLERLPAEPG